MSWFKTGFESSKDAWDFNADGGSRGPRRHWQPPETTNRMLFLEDDPTCLWEHNARINGSWKWWEPCKIRNKMDNVCAVCERYDDRWPYFVGLLTTINLTPWTSKKGHVFNLQREIFPAKLGGKDKPGILKKLEKLKAKHGRLRGLVFDIERTGAKTESCGDDFELVEKIDPGDIAAYRDAQVKAHLELINAKLAPEKQLSAEKFLARNPWTPFNFEEIIVPRSDAELRSILGMTGGNGGGKKAEEALDEDVPY